MNEGTQQVLFALQGATVVTRGVCQRFGIEASVVGQRILFEIPPGVFDGVQFRCVGRQKNGVNGAGVVQECHDGLGPMGLKPVPDEHDGMRVKLLTQLTQERDDQFSVDIGIGVEAKVQMHVIPPRGDTQRGDDGDLLVRTRALDKDRGLTAGVPTAPHQWRHQKPGFVEENEAGPQARSVFFTRGQSSLIHRWMPPSSRSIARRVGFCGLNPSPCSRRPI